LKTGHDCAVVTLCLCLSRLLSLVVSAAVACLNVSLTSVYCTRVTCVKVASALCYLDSLHYLLHRDIAARNFLVTEYNRVKLADFGRARYVYDNDYQAPASEMVCVKWSSPEVLLRSCYSTRSDLWAAAVVMWEVLTRGQRPYSCLSAEQTAVYVLNGGRLDRPDDCPQQLYVVMTSCWRHSATDRPSSAQLAQRLHEILRYLDEQRQSESDVRESHSSLRHQLASRHKSAVTTRSRLVDRQGTWNDVDSTSSSSSSSLSARAGRQAPVTAAGSADDVLSLTRADKIRHSLRKLVNIRT